MSDATGQAPLAYVRVVLDRPLPIEPGRYVIPTGEPASEEDRFTGVARGVAGADALLVGLGAPAGTRDGVAEATLVRASEPLRPDEAAAQRRQWKDDRDEVDQWVGAALAVLNRALRAYRVVQRDPYAIDLTLDDLEQAAVGCLPGDLLSDGERDDQELDVTPGGRRRRRNASERARPGAIVARALAGELPLLEGEELLAAAVREADHGRLRGGAAILQAARGLLERELGLRWDAPPPAEEREALLVACEELQDAVDRWRAGEDPAVAAEPAPSRLARLRTRAQPRRA
jgi:hypothetical protein